MNLITTVDILLSQSHTYTDNELTSQVKNYQCVFLQDTLGGGTILTTLTTILKFLVLVLLLPLSTFRDALNVNIILVTSTHFCVFLHRKKRSQNKIFSNDSLVLKNRSAFIDNKKGL